MRPLLEFMVMDVTGQQQLRTCVYVSGFPESGRTCVAFEQDSIEHPDAPDRVLFDREQLMEVLNTLCRPS